MGLYEVGAVYRSTFTTVDTDGDPVVPGDTPVLAVTLPDGTADAVTDLTPVAGTGDGEFYVDYPFTVVGWHKFAWSCTDPVQVQSEFLNVNEFLSIVGVQETKDFINDTDADRDPILRLIMAAATEKVEDIVGTCVPRTYTDESVPGVSQQVIRLPHAPVISVSSIESVYPNGPSWDDTQLIVYPDSGTVEVSSLWIPFWYGPWKATYIAGRSVISSKIRLATLEIIFDLWSIHRPYGADELEPGPEDTARFESMVGTYQIPPHAKSLLQGEEQPGFA